LLGAGSGALIGQAIGRDTEGTLLGAAVGSVLGYAIGNEMDKGGGYRPTVHTTVYQQPRMVVVRPESQKLCRETEVLATIDGRPETLYGTACWQDGEWVMMADEPPPPSFITQTVILREREHYRHGGHRHHRGRHWDEHERGEHERRVIYRAGW
jgi:surface antigen